ncbi:MAG TPA: sigma-54 dependent transcriptional regulator [Polyangia bacterium]|jgi:two-component system nitrogen regulation response regulator GlnG|nr:sigma-54 dependent transcriptional regulator [Polyangia bacterium]
MVGSKSPALDAIVGDAPELRSVLARARLVAPTGTPVLVTGESGTGKELLARALHELGPRPEGPLVTVNCGALPRELAESELFGHERGAFTGAAARRRGWFEEASGGTLVLDEIGELPLDLQPKLLRVLETGRIRRVGGAGESGVAVRVVAMTLRDLGLEARRGSFRADLYYRLAGFELPLPPLRSRRGDIGLLVRHFLRELAPELGAREIEPAALVALENAQWPGNIRELRNAVRRAAILTQHRIDVAALELTEPASFPAGEPALRLRLAEVDGALPGPVEAPRPPGDSLQLRGRTFAEIERDVYSWSLRENGGSRRRAAKALSIARSTFCEKVKKLGLG